jgi:hypothetical protein
MMAELCSLAGLFQVGVHNGAKVCRVMSEIRGRGYLYYDAHLNHAMSRQNV